MNPPNKIEVFYKFMVLLKKYFPAAKILIENFIGRIVPRKNNEISTNLYLGLILNVSLSRYSTSKVGPEISFCIALFYLGINYFRSLRYCSKM